MKIYKFELTPLNKNCCFFPSDIRDDEWVLYHGTSNIFEANIETLGFKWHNIIDKDDLINLLGIFRSMNWVNTKYSTLKYYTLNYDFSSDVRKPVFFASSAMHACHFALPEYAGGETLKYFCEAIDLLNDYLIDENLRRNHIDEQVREAASLINNNTYPSKIIEVDLDWLSTRLAVFNTLRNKVSALIDSYKYGIVYAVKFDSGDIENMYYDGSMGISYNGIINKNKIIAKCIIGEGLSFSDLLNDDSRIKEPDRKLPKLIKQKIGGFTVSGEYNYIPIDNAAGKDLAYEYSILHGSEFVKELLQKNPGKRTEFEL